MNIVIDKDKCGFYVMHCTNQDRVLLLRNDNPVWIKIQGNQEGGKFTSTSFRSREEAEQQLKKWFETQPPEVFAAYIAERMKQYED